MSDIQVYSLKDLSLEKLEQLVNSDVVFDIDMSLFKESDDDPLVKNHFFDAVIQHNSDIGD